MRSSFWSRAVFAVSGLLFVARLAAAQEAAGRNVADMKFTTIPPLPTCATASVQNGDPSKGPSILLARLAAGCSIPWHWHTPNESVMMVTGTGLLEMKDAKPAKLKAGGFGQLPSHHVHQLRCAAPCSVFVFSDAAFDIHYVDAQGKEIPPAEAMKAVKQTAATEMK